MLNRLQATRYLVAQLTERWGTRYSREGKTVWTEQPLTGTPA